MLTKSEGLFETFCASHGIRCRRIPTAAEMGERRPDYRIRRGHGRSVIVEVKQIEPNAAEQKAIAQGEITRFFDMPTVNPGQRIRHVIDAAGPQLRPLAKGRYPAIIVVYDTILGRSLHTDPYSFLTAMRGTDMVDVFETPDPERPYVFGEPRPGPGRRMRPDANTTISALALLYEPGSQPALAIYHNRYAAMPLGVSAVGSRDVRHFDISSDGKSWIERRLRPNPGIGAAGRS